MNGVTGIPTGLTELDKKTDGLQDNDLIVIAARPSVGKTAFALHLARHAAMAGNAVAVYSLEMQGERLGDRWLMAACNINPYRWQQRDSQSPRDSGGTHHRLGTGTTAYLRGRQFFRQHGSHPFERTATEKPQAV